jgi:23S rRNA (guanosine2251-2'-O)-methyltransferase
MAQEQVLYGLHAVSARLRQQPDSVRMLYVDRHRSDVRMRNLVELAATAKVECQTVDATRLDVLAKGGIHQGVIAIALPRVAEDIESVLNGLRGDPLILVLDGVTDPHNLGACLRTADAMGVHAVIAPKDRSAPLTSVVYKVASGAADSVPYLLVTNLARSLRELKDRGMWIAGSAGEAEDSVFDAKLTGPLALVLGAEGGGMRRLTREHCDILVSVPMFGAVESLNVSVAAGVLLFEVQRQRQFPGSISLNR